MEDFTEYLEDEFIIWNCSFGVRDFVSIGEIKKEKQLTKIWLEDPYDMVGPLNLEELLLDGEINFAACIIMTKQRWEKNQQKLRQEAYKKQKKIHQEFQENKKQLHQQNNQQEYRKLLSLPLTGKLKVSQIKAAYKKLAKAKHPDVGGTHEKFVLITEAKEALILTIS